MDFTPSPAQAEICATITRLCARFVHPALRPLRRGAQDRENGLEYHVERYLRESLIPRIAPVSPQLILCLIAGKMLGLPKPY